MAGDAFHRLRNRRAGTRACSPLVPQVVTQQFLACCLPRRYAAAAQSTHVDNTAIPRFIAFELSR
jgi:hypothetical protein